MSKTRTSTLARHTAECGCVVFVSEGLNVKHAAHIDHCPRHAAADDMLVACKDLKTYLDTLVGLKHVTGPSIEARRSTLRAAIAKAEGKR